MVNIWNRIPKHRLISDGIYLVKWILLGCGMGFLVGGVITGFYYALHFSTKLRMENPWIIAFLPAAGLFIVFLYRAAGDLEDKGTNLVILSISGNENVPLKKAPLIFVSTAVTHMFGGSSGRESAALQIGGCIGQNVGRALRLKRGDIKTITMCGMSAAFAALFGTPMSAALLAMEISSVGVLYYSALIPCVLSALVATSFSEFLGAEGDVFRVSTTPEFTLNNAVLCVILALLCALLSSFFCWLLHKAGQLYKSFFPNQYLRIAVGGGIVAALTFLLRTTIYNGAGMDVVELAFEGKIPLYAFLLKMLFTALTLGAGFKGGEIVPSLYIGASFGCTFATLFGTSVPTSCAIGMAAMFCGVTNCPIASLLLCFEMFGYAGIPYYFLAIAFAYTFSGYYGLYGSQKIVYSKTRNKYINRKTK